VKHLNSKKFFEEVQTITKVCKSTFADNGTLVILAHELATRATQKSVVYNGHQPAEDMWFVPEMDNEAGHCGYPVWTNNDQFENKLLGYHNGGTVHGSYFTPIYQEDFTQLEVEAQARGDFVPASVYPAEVASHITFNYETVKHIPGLKTECQILKDGKPWNYYMPNNTALRPTHLFEYFELNNKRYVATSQNKYMQDALQSKKKPANLRPHVVLNETGERILVNPLVNALSKYQGRNAPQAPADITQSKFYKGIFHSKFRSELVREATFKEVVNGIKGSKFSGPIDLSASAATGFAETGKTMRDLILGEDNERYFSKEVVDMLLWRKKNYYDKNLVPPYVCTATQKDELRSPQKVDYPRLFANGGKINFFEARQYCMTFFEQVLNHAGEGDVYIGINPHGKEWELLAQKMESKSSRKIITDDIASWDLCMKILGFVEGLVKELKRLQVNAELIKNIELVIVSTLTPFIVLGDHIYSSYQMPSGSYLTAVVNSMYNSWMNRVLWDCKHPDKDFDEFISQGTFGDDLIQSISESLEDDAWNGQVLAALRLQYFGLKKHRFLKMVGKYQNSCHYIL
jgi:hypothetical protein